MVGFVQNISPVLLKLGFLEIRYYGLVYALGFLLIWFFLRKNKKSIEITNSQIENLIFCIFVGMMVGARSFHFIFSEPSIFWKDPLELLKIWHGGMSFFGAFIGITFAVYLYLRKINKNFWKVADLFILPVSFALFLGRLANFFNSELVGTPAPKLSWCTVFPVVDDVCRHPYQIYAALSMILMFFILLFIWKNKEKFKNGALLVYFTLLYGLFRFSTDFFRADSRFFGMTVWQYISIVFFVFSLVFLIQNKFFRKNL